MPYKIRLPKQKEETPALVVQSEGWIEQIRAHPQWIWGGAGALVLVGLILAFAWYSNYQTEERAWALEAEASHLFHDPPPLPKPKEEGKPAPEKPEITDKTERLKESVRLYETLLQKYPGSSSAPLALYTSGHVYYALKEYEKAEKQYQTFLERYPNEKDWAAVIHLKLGFLRQIKGDNAAALAALRKAYELPKTKVADQAGLELGRLLEQMENKPEAIAIFKKVSTEFEKSPWGMDAKRRLDLLVPPTPTPEPTPTPASAGATATPTASSTPVSMAPPAGAAAPSPGAAPR